MTAADLDPRYYVDFHDEEIADKIPQILQAEGVVVITSVFDDAECQEKVASIAQSINAINPNVKPGKKATWDKRALPSGPRYGMFHSLVANLPSVWDIRTDPRVRTVFREAYSGVRGHDVDSFFTSLDGMTFRPPVDPYYSSDSPAEDWAHLDQTTSPDETFKCIQGQVVLTNSSAAFRASPRSHLLFRNFLEYAGRLGTSGNFCRFPSRSAEYMREQIEKLGGQYQIPFHAPRGSMILWLSSTVHSAQVQRKHAPRDAADPFSEWRCVVYVCFRPKAEADFGHGQLLQECVAKNKVTNHWGTKVFSPSYTAASVDPNIIEYLRSPRKVYTIEGLEMPDSEAVRELLYSDEELLSAKLQEQEVSVADGDAEAAGEGQ